MAKGENIYNGIKWDITIKKDEWESFGLIMIITGLVKKLNTQ